MLDKLEKNLNLKNSIFIVIFLVVVLYTIFGSEIDVGKIINDVPKEEITKAFDKINNNYTMDVEYYVNETKYNFSYQTDGNYELYEDSENEYIIKNNNFYKLDKENYKNVSTVKEINGYPNKYTDINLIKKLIKYCNYKYIDSTHFNCNIKVEDYLKEYNNYYNDSIPFTDESMNILINYYENINKLEIDYSVISKLIDKNDDSVTYKMSLSDINENNFSELNTYYNDIIK